MERGRVWSTNYGSCYAEEQFGQKGCDDELEQIEYNRCWSIKEERELFEKLLLLIRYNNVYKQ